MIEQASRRTLFRIRQAAGLALLLVLLACSGHAKRTATARDALNRGDAWAAVDALNAELKVQSAEQQPHEIGDDDSLLILDRAMILQKLARYQYSSADLQLADKHIEVLDFSRGALDDLGKYMFSDDSGPYQAPAYEKIMINTANMINYLCAGQLNGARIEARRFATMQSFLRNQNQDAIAPLALGNLVAALVFEASERKSEADNFFKDSAGSGVHEDWDKTVQAVKTSESCTAEQGCGELVIFLSIGRVPAKIARRIPIGLALTYASGFISPANRRKANYLAGQGLVTWVNFPELGEPRALAYAPSVTWTGGQATFHEAASLDVLSARAWRTARGAVIASAITRLISRAAAGEVSRRAIGGVAGALVSLGGQAALTAADTPDTRSWSTLPAKIYVARVSLPAGKHALRFNGQGLSETRAVSIRKDRLSFVNFSALR